MGLCPFMVRQGTAEIGLRIALGANSRNVLGAVLKKGLRMACTGLFLGFLGAYLVGRAMQSGLYGTGEFDWFALGVVAAILLVAASFACYFPARYASLIDPMVVLRRE
jgi:ABC-type antimicrobial peptide transport system permease subunit